MLSHYLYTGLYLSQLVRGNSSINSISISRTFAQQKAKNLRIYPSRLWCLGSSFLTTYLWWKKSIVWVLVVFFFRSVVWRYFFFSLPTSLVHGLCYFGCRVFENSLERCFSIRMVRGFWISSLGKRYHACNYRNSTKIPTRIVSG